MLFNESRWSKLAGLEGAKLELLLESVEEEINVLDLEDRLRRQVRAEILDIVSEARPKFSKLMQAKMKTRPVSTGFGSANQEVDKSGKQREGFWVSPETKLRYDSSSIPCSDCKKVGKPTRTYLGDEFCPDCHPQEKAAAARSGKSPDTDKPKRKISKAQQVGNEIRRSSRERLMNHIKRAVSTEAGMRSLARKWALEGQIDALSHADRKFVEKNMSPAKFSELQRISGKLKAG